MDIQQLQRRNGQGSQAGNEQHGLFLTFEGIDGSGKSTQVQLLTEALEQEGFPVALTREPGGTPIGEQIREMLLNPVNMISPKAEMLLYAASRAELAASFIRPRLEEGTIVLCDRFVDSSVAYQGYGRGLGDDVWKVNEPVIEGCMPDSTFVFDVPVDVSRTRVREQAEPDRIEKERAEFFTRVREGYLRQAERFPDRIIVIDGRKPIADIQRCVMEHVRKLLDGNR